MAGRQNRRQQADLVAQRWRSARALRRSQRTQVRRRQPSAALATMLAAVMVALAAGVAPVPLPAGAQEVPIGDEPDYTIALVRRLLDDPGIDPGFLEEVQGATEAVHGIVQLHSLPAAGGDDLERLERLGIRLLAYLNGIDGPGTAYLAAIDPGIDAGDPAFVELVRGLVALEPEDKLSLMLPPPDPEPDGPSVDAVGDDGLLVLFFPDVELAEAQRAFERAGLDASRQGESDLWLTGPAGEEQVAALADEDVVQWIEPEPGPGLIGLDEVRDESDVDVVHQLDTATGTYAGLSGDGVQIAIMDTGIDDQHNDFAGRIVRSSDDGGDHGSHVAGIAAGSGFQSDKLDDGGNPNGGSAFQWRGTAPEAELAAYGFVGGDAGVFDEAVNTFGVDVSNHSYVRGANVQGLYSADMGAVDTIVRGDSPGIAPRPWVYIAMNNASVSARDCDGDGVTDGNFPQYPFPGVPPGGACPTAYQAGYFSSLNACKNCLSIANVRKDLIHAGSSGLGPTMDGRLKPEVSAVGSGVTSVGADTDASGDPATGNGYRSKSGTSMAGPAVTGIVALMLEQYAQTFGVDLDVAPPLPSTSKAILVQTATDLAGTDPTTNFDTGAAVDYGDGPDHATGFGIADADAAVAAVADRTFVEDAVDLADTADEFAVSVVPGQTEVRVSLAWDDIAGAPNANAVAPQLVNDLDLVLVEPDGTEHDPLVLPVVTPRDCDANAANGVQVGTCIGQDPAGQDYEGPAAEGVDRRNNVEQAVVSAPGGLEAGTWTARVSVLDDDGVTVRLPLGGTQTYSLAGVTEQRADLVVTKSDLPDPVVAGEDLVYTVDVTNDGPDAATDVTVVDTLPAGVTLVADTGGCVEAPVGMLTCSLGDLASAASTSFTVTVNVDPALIHDAGGPVTLTNTATALSTVPDDDLADNTATEDTEVVALADLTIDKEASPAEAEPGEEVTFTLTVTNDGPSVATDVVVTDELPPATAFVSVTPSAGGACATPPVGGAGTVECTFAGPTAPGASRSVVIVVEVTGDVAELTVTNTATADSATVDPDLADNVDQASFDVVCDVVGTSGNDVLFGTATNDVICGLGGADRLYGLSAKDTLAGGPGNDLLEGGSDADLLLGGSGNDTLKGGSGKDRLRGEAGADRLEGGSGFDRLDGGPGGDVCLVQSGGGTTTAC